MNIPLIRALAISGIPFLEIHFGISSGVGFGKRLIATFSAWIQPLTEILELLEQPACCIICLTWNGYEM
jgi:hypothetical protein